MLARHIGVGERDLSELWGSEGWGDGCYSAIVNRQREKNQKSPRYAFNVETVSGRVAVSLT